MKTLNYLMVLLLCCTIIVSCENDIADSVDRTAESTMKATSKSSSFPLKISNRGYLMFHDGQEMESYIEYITHANLDEVLNLFSSNNFQPLNSVDYDKNLNPEKFTFNEAGLVQIGNNVFKISDDGYYLLSARIDLLNDDAPYQMMAVGQFEPQIMNRFSLFKDRGNADFNILDIVDGHPSGINEDEPPMVTMGKFWGKEEHPQSCNPATGKRWVNVVHRAFWIKTWVTGYYEDC